MGFPDGSEVKTLPDNSGDMGSLPGSGRSHGEGNGNHSNILAWEIAWKSKPGGFIVHGVARVRRDWATKQPQQQQFTPLQL